jgi:hypothetical protein
VYGLIDRNNLPGLFRTFDFPSPDASSPGRPETTVPQQALFALNAEFVQDCSRILAERTGRENATVDSQVKWLFRLALSRSPDASEAASLREILEAKELSLEEVAQALLMSNEFLFVD